MQPYITGREVALRLLCTVIAGTLIGVNRGAHGRAAGLRTNLLVCLAASLSMIQVNLLLNISGKAGNSFVVLDLMRLPLGILSGMGFIGAGAILRRDNLVLGITTAATLWFVTVLGLCFGGGQIGLGFSALALGLVILVGFKWIEDHWKEDQYAILTIETGPDGPAESEIITAMIAANFRISSSSITYREAGMICELTCKLGWHGYPHETHSPPVLKQLAARFQPRKIEWRLIEKT